MSQATLKYERIGQGLRSHIESGHYQPGQQLPGELELAESFCVSRGTVRQALMVLERDGLILRRRGSGSYVRDDLERFRNPCLKHAGFAVVDFPPDTPFYNTEIMAMEQALCERQAALSVTSLRTEDLAEGKLPPMLQSGMVDGLILDGVVKDWHVMWAQKLGIPFVVSGSHDIRIETPRIDFQIEEIAQSAVRLLHEQYREHEIHLLIEPFHLVMSREIFRGYAEQVARLPQSTPLVHPCPDDDTQAVVQSLCRTRENPFAIITTECLLPSIHASLQANGLEPAEIPTLAFATVPLAENFRRQCYIADLSGRAIATQAVDMLAELCDGYMAENSQPLTRTITTSIEPPMVGADAGHPFTLGRSIL
jgi:DNA-binding LacI/PurR family transcriptional regulator